MASDPVAHIRNAHERAEQLAWKSCNGGAAWKVGERADCGCCDRVTTTTGMLVAVADMDDAPYIAANSPAVVLRRVEAERAVLEACDTVLSGWYFGETKELAHDVIRGLAAGWGWEAGA